MSTDNTLAKRKWDERLTRASETIIGLTTKADAEHRSLTKEEERLFDVARKMELEAAGQLNSLENGDTETRTVPPGETKGVTVRKRIKTQENIRVEMGRKIEDLRNECRVAGRSETPQEKELLALWKEKDNAAREQLEEIRIMCEEGEPLPQCNDWPGMPGAYGRTHHDDTIGKQGVVVARYKTLFGASVSRDGWGSYQDFLSVIHSGTSHPKLTAMQEGTGAGGGWLVPTEYAAEQLDAAIESSIVASRARIYPMGSDTKKIAGFDSTTNTAGTLFGGIESQWIGESTGATVTNPRLRKIELKAKKLALFCSTSNELAEDGLNLNSQLDEAMRVASGWFSDYAFLRGTGSGQPLGVLNDPALVSVTIETAQDADSLVYENLCNMLSRIHPACFNNAVWVCNPSCIPQLLQLSQPIGTGGVQVPVLKETGGGWQIFTRPLLMTEKLPTIGDKGDIILADFSQYAIGLRRELTIEKSAHIRFMEDEVVWRSIARLDGQGRWNKAFTPANGVTQSWCVALAERA